MRRYTDQDLAIFSQARILLNRGLTFNQAGAQLQRELGGLATALHFVGDAQRIADLEAQIDALQQVIAAKDETIATMRSYLERLIDEIVVVKVERDQLRAWQQLKGGSRPRGATK